ncbi:cellulose synthase-like protein E6 isoform X2 [Ananas comosus]|uniref:Cellulose synthase-like protein E6 isoform X2 n=1 Tax=Ananas comosus TaxID=4615 RepID=A0A6P5GPJ9_ANACO|nr:cellulose synthase-like protein E6 isoform X2 [Ananas comosus]
MVEGEGDGSPLFETEVAEGIGRIWYKLHALSVFVGICGIWAYRALHIPNAEEEQEQGQGRWWAWIGLFGAELWFGLYWVLKQAVRWNPTYRRTFKARLSQRNNLPGVDIFVCTADLTIEPPIMVINTVLSVLAYDYPKDKLSVYLSDDGGSELTFYALLEASHFARTWIPFCQKFNVETRSPAAYFKESHTSQKDVTEAVEWIATKNLYKEMENRINQVTRFGRLSNDIRKQHKGFCEWNVPSTSCDHHAIVEILIDGRDENATDNEGVVLPTLVYMAREKRPEHHHNFKAGAMNSLLRVSSEISNGAVILNMDCDMYSNNSETIKDALCFFMDEDKGHEFAYVQLPQRFNNITKNDIYANCLRTEYEVEFHGLDGFGGPLYVGSGCFHRRESLCGKKYESNKAEMKYNKRNTRADASTLEEKAKSLITCTFEDNTEWGKEVGLKYGFPVEDVITGLSIQCRGWKSIYFNPPRVGFLGVAPVTLAQTLVQHKRWSEGNFQIFLSKYNPLLYGHKKIKLGLQLGYNIYFLWAPCSFPTIYYAIIPSFALLHAISLFPSVHSIWFAPFAYVIGVTTIHSLWESKKVGYTLKGWWNERRMWLFKRLASYPFAATDAFLKLLDVKKLAFIVTAKVADEEVSKRYEKEVMEFGSASLMFIILSAHAVFCLLCLLGGVKKLVLDGTGEMSSMLVQLTVTGAITLINMPIYQAMFLRVDGGCMPISVTIISVGLAMLACIIGTK